MINTKRCFVAVAVLLLFVSLAFSQPSMTRIIHDPVISARIGEPIKISARLEGSGYDDQVMEAKVWYRSYTEETFDYIELFPELESYKGLIPQNQVSTDGMVYYLEFIFADDSRLTYPEFDAVNNPVMVKVQNVKAQKESSLIIISPEPNKVLPAGDVLVAAAINQAHRAIDPENIRLKINGKDVTRKANITYDIITYVTDNLKIGRHRVDIVLNSKEGSEILANWFFTVRPEKEHKKYIERNFHGQVSLYGSTQKFGDLESNIAEEYFSLRGNYGKLNINGYARLTSEEQSNIQPRHRFQFSLGMPWYELKVGDINPRYNELILWGRRVRGAELRLGTASESFGVTAVVGDMYRAIEGSLNPTTQDTIGGTYRRWMGAARINFGSGKHFQLGITGMKVKDDIESIDYGNKPKDNLISGADMSIFADKKRISITAQTAVSLYCDDTSADPLSDLDDIKDIIWINEDFDPLPSEDSDDINKIIGSIMEKSLSAKVRLRLRYYNNDFRVGFKRINRSFNNLANSSVNADKDRQGFFVRDRIRLFRSMLFLDGGFESYSDNLGDSRNETLTDNRYNIGFSLYTNPTLPNFYVEYRNYSRENDGSLTTIETGVDENNVIQTQEEDTRIDNSTDYISFTITQEIPTLELGAFRMFNKVSFVMNTNEKTDNIDSNQDLNYGSYSIYLNSKYDYPFETDISYSTYDQEYLDATSDDKVDRFSFNLKYFLLNRKLSISAGPEFYKREGKYISPYDLEEYGDTDVSGIEKSKTIDVSSINWNVSLAYEFLPNHVLDGRFYMTNYDDKSMVEYLDGSTESMSDIDQDNMIASLTYSYRF